jgi:hypothetical protein
MRTVLMVVLWFAVIVVVGSTGDAGYPELAIALVLSWAVVFGGSFLLNRRAHKTTS